MRAHKSAISVQGWAASCASEASRHRNLQEEKWLSQEEQIWHGLLKEHLDPFSWGNILYPSKYLCRMTSVCLHTGGEQSKIPAVILPCLWPVKKSGLKSIRRGLLNRTETGIMFMYVVVHLLAQWDSSVSVRHTGYTHRPMDDVSLK